MHSYNFADANSFSKVGVERCVLYLMSVPGTVSVKNVENDTHYQKIDVDLLWTYTQEGEYCTTTIEVKTDRYRTGNFFFETLSNEEKSTPGCFLMSEADFLYYYFTSGTLYIIPLDAAREWFFQNQELFREMKTTTHDGNGIHRHTTVGRLVPIDTILAAVQTIQVIELD